MTASTTIRVREHTRRALAAIARREGRTIPDVVAELVERVEAEAMFSKHNAAMMRLREDSERAAEHDLEQRFWERTLMDGLEHDPWPTDERGEPER